MIEFTFDKDNHIYKIPGQFVLSTSDVISLNGLSNMGQVPQKTLDHAAWRGTQLHHAVELFEAGSIDFESIPDEVMPYFQAYLKFREEHDFQIIHPCEKQVVYQHEGTEQLIGATIDLRGHVDDRLCVVDLKSCYQYTGSAKRQMYLRWRIQLQSYIEACESDEDFMNVADGLVGKYIVHCHKDASYTLNNFCSIDDSFLWDAAIRMATAKLSAGYKLGK